MHGECAIRLHSSSRAYCCDSPWYPMSGARAVTVTGHLAPQVAKGDQSL